MPHDLKTLSTHGPLTTNRLRARPGLRIATAIVVAGLGLTTLAPHAARGQDATMPAGDAGTAAAGQASGGVASDVEDFWHYAKIARYDIANAKAKAILDANPNPADVLAAFEKTADKRAGEDVTEYMLRFQAIPELTENTKALEKILAEGRYGRRSDAKFIESNIQRLITNEIGYQNGVTNLRNSGEMAVPLLLDYLRDSSKSQYHDAVRRAMKDLGRVALNPLVAATEMKDVDTLSIVINLLGELGYSDVVPYVMRIQQTTTSDALKDVAGQTLAKLGASGTSADASFLDLANKVYYGKSAIQPDSRNPTAFVWYWTEDQGLLRKDVPQGVFPQIMAMREAEYALQLSQQGDVGDQALSLWLAANYKREVELAGAPDPTRMENQPDAHYYGVTSGPKYLGNALKRTLDDKDSAVAFQLLKSEQEIVGNKTLDISGPAASRSSKALSYPDRKVRFEAAFALAAAAKPTDRVRPAATSVVPLLGEALSQTGKPTALVVAGQAPTRSTRSPSR